MIGLLRTSRRSRAAAFRHGAGGPAASRAHGGGEHDAAGRQDGACGRRRGRQQAQVRRAGNNTTLLLCWCWCCVQHKQAACSPLLFPSASPRLPHAHTTSLTQCRALGEIQTNAGGLQARSDKVRRSSECVCRSTPKAKKAALSPCSDRGCCGPLPCPVCTRQHTGVPLGLITRGRQRGAAVIRAWRRSTSTHTVFRRRRRRRRARARAHLARLRKKAACAQQHPNSHIPSNPTIKCLPPPPS